MAAAWLYLTPVWALAADVETVNVKLKRGVSQPIQLIVLNNPKAAVILFIGGNGSLGENENNFLLTTKKRFAEKGLMVALVAPPEGMNKVTGKFRISKKHAGDIIAVMNYLRKKADVPIWMVGTSMGTFSAASVAIKKQKRVAGLVLTSTMTDLSDAPSLKGIAKKFPDGAASLNLKKLKIPVLIMSHASDQCAHTPPKDAKKLKSKLSRSSRVEVVLLEGGLGDKSDPCKALSSHGFYGIEEKAVDRIVKFITQ
jgi:pimeloyl-ACP methyl ester carboxylesterase